MSDREAQIGKDLDEEMYRCCKHDRVPDRKTTFISRARISPPPEPLDFDGPSGTGKGKPSSVDLESASSWSDDMHGLGNLDPQRSIILRFECMSATELKVSASSEATVMSLASIYWQKWSAFL